jgi:hypothetical protein
MGCQLFLVTRFEKLAFVDYFEMLKVQLQLAQEIDQFDVDFDWGELSFRALLDIEIFIEFQPERFRALMRLNLNTRC